MSSMQIVTGIGLVLVLVAAFVAVDRILARRDRGERTFAAGTPTTVGNALMELQSFIDPSVRHRLEEEHRQRDEEEAEGDPPVAGDTSRARGPAAP